MGSPIRYPCYRKEMLGWIYEKMATPKSAPGGGRFSTFGLIAVGLAFQLTTARALQVQKLTTAHVL